MKKVENRTEAKIKPALGSVWKEVLDFIILRESPESYVEEEYEDGIILDPHIQPGIQKSTLIRMIKQEYGVEWKELKALSTIYLVSFSIGMFETEGIIKQITF